MWPALLFLLCSGFYWKLTLTSQYTWLDSPDIANMEMPRFQYQATEWRQGRFPLWDPYQWCGQPLLGQIVGAAYPLNWPLFLMPLTGGKIRQVFLNWFFVLIHYQAILFCYLLCRDLGRGRPASALAALVFGLGGFLGNTAWPQLLHGAIWAPLIFLFLLRALRGRKPVSSAALSGLFLGISWLSGHHEAPIYISLTAACVWIAAIMRSRSRRLVTLRLASIAALFMVLAAGFQVLPGYEYGKLAKRWAGIEQPVSWNQAIPYTVHSHYSFTPASLLGIVTPRLSEQMNPFVGIAAFTLALFGVLAGWRKQWPVRMFAAIALAGLLLSMAASNVFHGLLYSALPMFGKARVPARAIVIFSFALAPLVAYGFDALRHTRNFAKLTRVSNCLYILGGGIFAMMFAASYIKGFDPHEPAALTGLAAILLASLLSAWRKRAVGPAVLAAGSVFLVLFELGNVSAADMQNQQAPVRPSFIAPLYKHADIAAFLKAQPRPLRVNLNDEEIPYNFGDWHGVDTLGGYMAGVTANLLEIETHTPRTQDLLAVNFTVDRQPRRPDQELVFHGESGINVYRNPNAFPRTWTMHEAVRFDSYDDLRLALQNPAWDLRAKAPMLTPPPVLERCQGTDDVRLTSMSASRTRIETIMRCRGMLVLADTAFPGWKVTVDGHPAQMEEPYAALRGVVLDAGRHIIEFRYQPSSAIAGAAMTASGLLAALVLVLIDRKRRP